MNHIPHTCITGNETLNVYNIRDYARNNPRFVAGTSRTDAMKRWNTQYPRIRITINDLDQIFIEGDRLYTIGYNGEHRRFGYCPRPEVYVS